MAVRKIALMGHPVLRQAARLVEDPHAPKIAALVKDLIDTLEDVGSCGMAAPQVYESIRLVVYRLTEDRIPAGSNLKPVPWTAVINPVIEPLVQDKVMVWERCLSLPGLHGKVPRHPKVRLSFIDLEGRPVQQVAEGFLATMFQHECDHLDGILYPMRMTDLSLLSFNAEPGPLAEEARKTRSLDPLFADLVARWPGRHRWIPSDDETDDREALGSHTGEV